jgi:outer membrane protein insertion porin family
MLTVVFLLLAQGTQPDLESGTSVRSVEIAGSRARVELSTQVGQSYNAVTIQKDVRRLWSTGRFDDIRVMTTARPDGLAVVFKVHDAHPLRYRKLVMEPHNLGLTMVLEEGTPIDWQRAQLAAREARKQLHADGYINAHVDADLIPIGDGQADLRLRIQPGERIRVSHVSFETWRTHSCVPRSHSCQRTADIDVDTKALSHSLRAVRPRRILGWPLFPAYSEEAVDADLNRLHSFYVSQGYLDAKVWQASTVIQQNKARIAFGVDAGRRYQVHPCDACASLFQARREAQRQGILDFSATLHIDRSSGASASLTQSIERGPAFHLGRIEFTGNHHYSDSLIRRNVLLEEGQLLDELLLRRSVARLNRTGLFEPIQESDVAIRTGASSDVGDVFVHLKERQPRAWRISGPVGPASFAGPLEASISSRVPPWGSGLLELATYTASISVFAFAHPLLPLSALNVKRPLLPVLALSRPFSPGEGWRSGFSIAPQLGWKSTAISYSATQSEQRLSTLLSGDRGLETELSVTIDDPNGTTTMICQPPPQRFAMLRTAAGMSLHLLRAMSGI